jgi:ACR3 family arsenite efflux pump ArsB
MIDSILKGLSWLDRFLAPLVLLAMILGVVIGISHQVSAGYNLTDNQASSHPMSIPY